MIPYIRERSYEFVHVCVCELREEGREGGREGGWVGGWVGKVKRYKEYL